MKPRIRNSFSRAGRFAQAILPAVPDKKYHNPAVAISGLPRLTIFVAGRAEVNERQERKDFDVSARPFEG
jgi:hypothetical protein